MGVDIRFEQVSYTYQAGTPFAAEALRDVNVTLKAGGYTAVIGHTGSGKSTFIQHLNGLKVPTTGSVYLGERELSAHTGREHLKPFRQKVGLVFQFPEAQLFEETVGEDIAFGPQNFGATKEEALAKAREVLPLVGLDESFMDRSPFELSGGQMRRVAIAGVLALEPEVLVLDEPTAGLDPRGSEEMLQLFERLHRERGLSIVLVTHQMDDVARFADRVLVFESGRIVLDGTPAAVFKEPERLKELQLGLPRPTAFAEQLSRRGARFEEWPLTTAKLAAQLAPKLPQKEERREVDG